MGEQTEIDFDLGGVVGSRLIHARPDDAANVRRQLGLIESPLSREPDLSIRFVDALRLKPPLRYLGLHQSAFTDDAFVLFGERGKRVTLPFDTIGAGGEIECETGIGPIPMLVAMVNLVAVAKGVIPLHASAFNYRGTGVLVTGWAKGGKTEVLLPFALAGAGYIGDEWVYVASDGHRMFGLPEPVTLWDWHIDEFPKLRSFVTGRRRARLFGLRLAHRASDALGARLRSQGGAGTFIGKASALIERQRDVRVPPEELFGARLDDSGIDKILWVASHDEAEIRVVPVDPTVVVRRLVQSVEYEWLRLRSTYLQYRTAFPERHSELVERSESEQVQALEFALGSKEMYEVYHPFPAPIARLYKALEPVVRP
jgi:hypothetical protein